MLKQFVFLCMLFLALVNACAATPRGNIISIPDLDAGFAVVEVSLQGFPEALQVNEVEVDVISPLVPGGGVNGEAIIPLARGVTAPFSGVLFNGPAVARVAVEFRFQREQCIIQRERELEILRARYNADIATLELALSSQARTAQVMLNGRAEDIVRLRGLIESQQRQMNGPNIREGLIWSSVGFAVGALVVGVIALSVGR